MKIKKVGKVVRGTMRVNCKSCKAKLKIKPKDIIKKDQGSKYGPTRYYYYYKCPCCKNCSNLKELPNEFLNKL